MLTNHKITEVVHLAYTEKEWLDRIRNRSDFSTFLSHLTRENGQMNVVEVLIKILEEGRIRGSSNSGFIAGGFTATCFQDAPMYSLSQNCMHEQNLRAINKSKIRYRGLGLAFPKRYIYAKGGRPVIYEKLEIAKQFVNPNEWWRIVSLDLDDDNSIVDWTHEREWRKLGDFEFDLSETYVLLSQKDAYRQFMKKAGKKIIEKVAGIIVLQPVLS